MAPSASIISGASSSDVTVAAGGLAAARAELTRLQDRERELVEELRSVRLSAQAQTDRINNFFKQHKLPPPITRLPLSVLSDIIYHAISVIRPESDAHRCTKRQLASVSRRWRDAILHFPNLWTTIVIHPSWSTSLIKTHVKRSGECPMEIRITNWTSSHTFSTFNDLVGVVVTCGYRWRSLTIQENDEGFGNSILDSIKNMMFSSLRSVEIISGAATKSRLPFLSSGYAPGLERLTLLGTDGTDQVSAATNLRSVRFHLVDDGSGSRLLLSLLPLRQLTELVLSGSSDQWPEPRSIHLPALTSLTLTLPDPTPALDAMVIPNLIELKCSCPRDPTHNWGDVFENFLNRFTSVRKLHLLGVAGSPSPPLVISDALRVCLACPGVRQAELPADVIDAFFGKSVVPADCWEDLEALTFKGLKVGTVPRNLVRWLVRRRTQRKPLLQVTFCEFNKSKSLARSCWVASLCDSLCDCCKLELKEVPLTATLNMDPSVSLVDAPGASRVYDSPGMVTNRYMWCCDCYDWARY